MTGMGEQGALYLVSYQVSNGGTDLTRIGRVDVRWSSPAASMEDVAAVDAKLSDVLRQRGVISDEETVSVLGWTRLNAAPS